MLALFFSTLSQITIMGFFFNHNSLSYYTIRIFSHLALIVSYF